MKGEYWVCAGSESASALGLLSFLRSSLSASDATVAVISSDSQTEALFAAGAHKLYAVPDASEERLVWDVVDLCRKHLPAVLLFPATIRLRQAASQISAILECGLCADCTGLSLQDDGQLLMIRPAYGEHLIAEILCKHTHLQMATVRPGIFLPSFCYSRYGEIVSTCSRSEKTFEGLITLLEETSLHQEPLSDSRLIIAGGKGIGSQGFSKLRQLVSLTGASLGASRAAVNAGYAPYCYQVGLTGTIVHPKTYIAFGISGAVQHLAGMNASGYVIAVNTDPKAPIFDYADLSFVGSWEPLVDALIQHFSAKQFS